MTMKNRRANAVLFGFDFQRNAAIVLMLENIKELRSVRLEGNEEDIELTLENGQKILAQAKAVEIVVLISRMCVKILKRHCFLFRKAHKRQILNS